VEELSVGKMRKAESPPFLLPPHRRTQIYGGLHHLPFHCPTSGMPISLSLSQRQCLLIGGAFHLQIFSILMQISTPRLTTATPKPLCKIVSIVKR
jgi:hypothetical protein